MSAVRPARIVVENVRKEFGAKVALRDISLTVEPGTFSVLLGPSGSGKTTLLRCLAGIEQPTSGRIDIGDVTVWSPQRSVSPHLRNLSMVFQDYALWPHLSVEKNVGYPLGTSTLTKAARASRVADLLERVGISALAQRFPNELSGGEQQRVALARALAGEVGLVLFDEPLSNLDADRREQLRIEIATLTRDAGATAVYITHDQSEAFALADRVGVLRDGALVQYDTPEKIYREPASAFVARFTGVAAEFRVTNVRTLDGERVVAQLPLAHAVDVTATRIGSPEASHAVLFVRASGVRIHTAQTPGGVGGVVRDVAFNGRGYEHVIEVASDSYVTKVFDVERCERGRRVTLAFDPAACFVMSFEEDVRARNNL